MKTYTYEEKIAFKNFFRFYLVISFISIFLVSILIFILQYKNYKENVFSQMRLLSSQYSTAIINSAMNNKGFSKDSFIFKDGYEFALYDKNEKAIYSTIKDIKKVDFNKNLYEEKRNYILVDNGSSGHLGIYHIVIKETILNKQINDLLIYVIIFSLMIYLLSARFGYFLSKRFISPIIQQRNRLNNFIKDTTHELNTPITGLLICMGLPDPSSEKNLKRMKLNVKRISEIYKDLTYHLLENKKTIDLKNIQNLNLKKILTEHIDYFEEFATKKRIELSYDFYDTFYKIDEESFIRLFSNIIGNALKYTHTNGSINISLAHNRLIVKDTGIGIEEDKLKSIFDRYYRATSENGGFGIGLNIVYKICQIYNIKFDIKSKINKGTTFILDFK